MPSLPHPLFVTLLCGLTLGLSGCASRKAGMVEGPQASAAPRKVQSVGKVAMVNQMQGFVLIDAVHVLQPGMRLRTVDPASKAETATLAVSPEQSRPFYIGEIGSGQPKRGDWVLHYTKDAPTAETTVEGPSTPTPPGSLPPLPPLPPLPDEPGSRRGSGSSSSSSDPSGLPELPDLPDAPLPEMEAPPAAPPSAPAQPSRPAPPSSGSPSAPPLPELPPLPPLPEKSAFD